MPLNERLVNLPMEGENQDTLGVNDMTPAQYLASCKVKLGHISDYELAKRWEINDGYMSNLMRGKRPINAHIAFLIAITLERDPALVLAEIEAQQQTGKAGEFWRSFLLRARAAAAAILCTLAFVGSAGIGSDLVAAGGRFKLRRPYFA